MRPYPLLKAGARKARAADGPAGRRVTPEGPRPDHNPVEQALALQRTIGNQATLQCLAQGATPADRRHEQAADHTAEQVLHGTAPVADGAVKHLDPPSRQEPVRAAGAPLPPAVRAVMEPGIGYDLAHVRVHTGSDAARSARELGAEAFTLGA